MTIMSKPNIDWTIHCCRNGVVCDICGDMENGFIENACNAHTHGMKKYGHMDFQLVLAYSNKEICRILNTFGLWVQQGRRFAAGDLVSGIYEDCDVRLDAFEETGRAVLRVIIPDKHNIFPNDKRCMYPYTLQTIPTDLLWSKGGTRS